MMKTMSKETKVKKTIGMINSGKTWEEISNFFGHSVAYIQKIVRESYKTPTRYNNLLRKARENKKLKEIQSAEESSKPVTVEAFEAIEEEVILVETGYLLKSEISVLTQNEIPIYIPSFCVNELNKMAKDNEKAKEILETITATNSIQQIDLRKNECFYIEPYFGEYKSRSKGIAAVAKYLSECNWHVKVLTYSKEVLKILEEQKSDNINVILAS